MSDDENVRLTASELLRKGGEWLGAARNWHKAHRAEMKALPHALPRALRVPPR